MTQTALGNLWHLLHILLPALSLLPRPEPSFTELILDGLSPGRGATVDGVRLLQGSLAGRFLQLITDTPPVVLGDSTGPQHRCYQRASWGHEAVTLFGRDKGGLKLADARRAVDSVGQSPHFVQALPRAALDARFFRAGPFSRGVAGEQHGTPLPWRLLYVSRPKAARRIVENEAEVGRLLQSLADSGRARVARVDFAGEELALNAAAQWRLASVSDILVGPHGAGLAWSAFMSQGRILIELMPHMRALDRQLCKRDISTGSRWDMTPMYAYGGLCALLGLRHVCLLGEPPESGPAGGGLAHELGYWHSAPIRVDLAALRAVAAEALGALDKEHAEGRVCPLAFRDELICPEAP